MLTEQTPDASACWEWKGATDSDGYGVFELRGKARQAHIVAYQLKVGPIEKGNVLLHICDNPPCSNYHHLIQGSQAENMQDMVSKGRHGNRYVSPVSSPDDVGTPTLEINQVCGYCGELVPALSAHLVTCAWAEEARLERMYGEKDNG